MLAREGRSALEYSEVILPIFKLWRFFSIYKEASLRSVYMDSSEAYKGFVKRPGSSDATNIRAKCLYLKSGALYEMGYYARALELLDEALDLKPNCMDLKNIFGIIVEFQEVNSISYLSVIDL